VLFFVLARTSCPLDLAVAMASAFVWHSRRMAWRNLNRYLVIVAVCVCVCVCVCACVCVCVCVCVWFIYLIVVTMRKKRDDDGCHSGRCVAVAQVQVVAMVQTIWLLMIAKL
jgi:hypothetical protein